jgi:hypothetical protein
MITKHDHELWIIDKMSHYEYFATYVDDMRIWSKGPMGVIKSLEKIYVLKNGLGLDIAARTYIQNVIPRFEGLFEKI